MQYMLMPLNKHYDSGLGSVANAFLDAAMALIEAKPRSVFFEHLPQCYLFRHAIELFLKSGIVILHKRFRLPYGTKPFDSDPTVAMGVKRKPIWNVHNIGVLYREWKLLIEPRTDELAKCCSCETDWTVGLDMDEWIKTIDGVDPGSTYFRYPSMKSPAEDQQKSHFKNIAPEALFPTDAPENRRIMAFVVVGENDEVKHSYMCDKNSDEFGDYLKALEEAAKCLYSYHAMMRMGLTGGF